MDIYIRYRYASLDTIKNTFVLTYVLDRSNSYLKVYFGYPNLSNGTCGVIGIIIFIVSIVIAIFTVTVIAALFVIIIISILIITIVIIVTIIIKSPRYTGGDFMFLYRFVRRRQRRRRRRPQIFVHAITFEQLFGFLSLLARLLALTCSLPD